jgi:hypothetical protein
LGFAARKNSARVHHKVCHDLRLTRWHENVVGGDASVIFEPSCFLGTEPSCFLGTEKAESNADPG